MPSLDKEQSKYSFLILFDSVTVLTKINWHFKHRTQNIFETDEAKHYLKDISLILQNCKLILDLLLNIALGQTLFFGSEEPIIKKLGIYYTDMRWIIILLCLKLISTERRRTVKVLFSGLIWFSHWENLCLTAQLKFDISSGWCKSLQANLSLYYFYIWNIKTNKANSRTFQIKNTKKLFIFAQPAQQPNMQTS